MHMHTMHPCTYIQVHIYVTNYPRFDLVVFGDALDGALAHCGGGHDILRVVVDGAVDRHVVAVEGLPDEAVWRHLMAV